jgi:hypothetical protein
MNLSQHGHCPTRFTTCPWRHHGCYHNNCAICTSETDPGNSCGRPMECERLRRQARNRALIEESIDAVRGPGSSPTILRPPTPGTSSSTFPRPIIPAATPLVHFHEHLVTEEDDHVDNTAASSSMHHEVPPPAPAGSRRPRSKGDSDRHWFASTCCVTTSAQIDTMDAPSGMKGVATMTATTATTTAVHADRPRTIEMASTRTTTPSPSRHWLEESLKKVPFQRPDRRPPSECCRTRAARLNPGPEPPVAAHDDRGTHRTRRHNRRGGTGST